MRAVFDIASKLPAGGVNVITPGLANRGDDASIAQDFRKFRDPAWRRPYQARGWKRIEWNQVELAPDTALGVLPHQFNQLLCMFRLVVDAVEHAILKRDEIAWRIGQVAVAGVHQFRYRILLVQRHQAITQAVIGRMQ